MRLLINLVRTRFREMKKRSPAIFPPRYASASSKERANNVSSARPMGQGAAPERDLRSSTNGPLPPIAVTRSAFFGRFAVATIASRRSVFTGPLSSGRRLTRKTSEGFPMRNPAILYRNLVQLMPEGLSQGKLIRATRGYPPLGSTAFCINSNCSHFAWFITSNSSIHRSGSCNGWFLNELWLI